MNAEVDNILNSGDGNSPSVQRREGSVTPSGQDWSDVHIELLSLSGDFGGIAQTEEHHAPNVEVESSSLSTPSRTLAVTVGTPLDHECPACKAPKGVPCRSVSTHYDRVVLIRLSV
jgi:hypothetical protein